MQCKTAAQEGAGGPFHAVQDGCSRRRWWSLRGSSRRLQPRCPPSPVVDCHGRVEVSREAHPEYPPLHGVTSTSPRNAKGANGGGRDGAGGTGELRNDPRGVPRSFQARSLPACLPAVDCIAPQAGPPRRRRRFRKMGLSNHKSWSNLIVLRWSKIGVLGGAGKLAFTQLSLNFKSTLKLTGVQACKARGSLSPLWTAPDHNPGGDVF